MFSTSQDKYYSYITTLDTLYIKVFTDNMREATAFAGVLVVLFGVLAITQLDTLRATIQASLSSGPLSDFVGFWPFIMVALTLGGAAVFAVGIASRMR